VLFLYNVHSFNARIVDHMKFRIGNLCPIYNSKNFFGLLDNYTKFADVPESIRPIFPNIKK